MTWFSLSIATFWSQPVFQLHINGVVDYLVYFNTHIGKILKILKYCNTEEQIIFIGESEHTEWIWIEKKYWMLNRNCIYSNIDSETCLYNVYSTQQNDFLHRFHLSTLFTIKQPHNSKIQISKWIECVGYHDYIPSNVFKILMVFSTVKQTVIRMIYGVQSLFFEMTSASYLSVYWRQSIFYFFIIQWNGKDRLENRYTYKTQ